MAPWWTSFVGLLGVIVGLGYNWLKEDRRRKAVRLALWTSLDCDLDLCRREALTYLEAEIDAPAYRLPTKAFEGPAFRLLEDGGMSADDYEPLLAFFDVVDQANRGLDLAQAARERGDMDQQEKEAGRVRLKMTSLVTGRSGKPPLYAAARDVIRRHLH